jgi:uncharacterized damage-inducible protein DinB
LSGLEKPCSYEKRNTRYGDHLLERARRDDGGAVGCACPRLLIAWQSEDREQGQARDGADQTDFRDHLAAHRRNRDYRTITGAGRLSIDREMRENLPAARLAGGGFVGETAEQYTARMLGLAAGHDPIKVLAATPAKLRRLITAAPRRVLTRSPAPDKWSIAQIVAHLADTEIVFAYRLRMILSRDGTEIQAFDQEKWAEVVQYDRVNTQDALTVFAAVRRTNLALLKRVTPAQRKQFGMHQERGKETVEHLGRMNAGHDLNHLGQIERIVKGTRSK